MWNLVSFIILLPVMASATAYEECHWSRRDLTERITSRFLDDEKCNCAYDYLPSSKNLKRLGEMMQSLPSVYNECFVQSVTSKLSSHTQSGRFRVCVGDRGSRGLTEHINSCYKTLDDENRVRCVNTRRPCANENYIKVISQAFHSTMQCLGLNPRDMFALYNHEGQFKSNKLSHTGAACPAQITSGAIDFINRFNNLNFEIYSQRGSLSEETVNGLRLTSVLNSCPFVKKHFQKIKTTLSRRGRPYIREAIHRCEQTDNPYSCFLYSAINHKINLEYAKDLLSKQKMYVIRAAGRDLFFRNEKDYLDFLKRKPEYKDSTLKIMPLFKDTKDVTHIAALWAYNGGLRVIKSSLKSFLDEQSILLETASNRTMRTDFLVNGGITTEAFVNQFQEFIYDDYRWPPSPGRKREVSEFVPKIKAHLKKYVTEHLPEGATKCSNTASFISPQGGA